MLSLSVSPSEMLRVVIIGAGAAGMAAATHLVAGGLHTDQLTILEAQHRIGGRIHTVNHSTCGSYPFNHKLKKKTRALTV